MEDFAETTFVPSLDFVTRVLFSRFLVEGDLKHGMIGTTVKSLGAQLLLLGFLGLPLPGSGLPWLWKKNEDLSAKFVESVSINIPKSSIMVFICLLQYLVLITACQGYAIGHHKLKSRMGKKEEQGPPRKLQLPRGNVLAGYPAVAPCRPGPCKPCPDMIQVPEPMDFSKCIHPCFELKASQNAVRVEDGGCPLTCNQKKCRCKQDTCPSPPLRKAPKSVTVKDGGCCVTPTGCVCENDSKKPKDNICTRPNIVPRNVGTDSPLQKIFFVKDEVPEVKNEAKKCKPKKCIPVVLDDGTGCRLKEKTCACENFIAKKVPEQEKQGMVKLLKNGPKSSVKRLVKLFENKKLLNPVDGEKKCAV